MNVVNNILELPKEYYMHHISGKTTEERMKTAQALITKDKIGWYIDSKKCGHLFLVDKKLVLE